MNINYRNLVDAAMLSVVKNILMYAQAQGLKNDQCLYISFRTDYPQVVLSEKIKNRYKKEITIALQYEYKNLTVLEDRFSVSVAFSGIHEIIEVPFAALISFLEPSANFGLKFGVKSPTKDIFKTQTEMKKKNFKSARKIEEGSGKIIYLEQFRNRFK